MFISINELGVKPGAEKQLLTGTKRVYVRPIFQICF